MAALISVSDVHDRFAAYAGANDSSVDLAFTDGNLMIARCVLPLPFEVRPGDIQKGGVAVRATIEEVEVRPYLFRLVCANGAIMMRSIAGRSIATADCTESWLSEAFAAAGSREALANAVSEVRNLAGTTFDRAFMLATVATRFRGFENSILREILKRMIADGSTGYSLMNAVTSVARDTRDPQTRWRLESAGGDIPALLLAGPRERVTEDALDLPAPVSTPDRELQLV